MMGDGGGETNRQWGMMENLEVLKAINKACSPTTLISHKTMTPLFGPTQPSIIMASHYSNTYTHTK